MENRKKKGRRQWTRDEFTIKTKWSSEQFDWNEIITKTTLTVEAQHEGNVDGLETTNSL